MKVGMHKLSIESKYQVCKDTEANQPSPITKHQGSISTVMKNVNHCGDTSKTHQDRFNEKTTEGILKAARLGDLKMLTELHREGSSIFLDRSAGTVYRMGSQKSAPEKEVKK